MLNITILLYFFKYKNVMLNYNFNSLQGTLYQEIARIQLQCSETIGVKSVSYFPLSTWIFFSVAVILVGFLTWVACLLVFSFGKIDK